MYKHELLLEWFKLQSLQGNCLKMLDLSAQYIKSHPKMLELGSSGVEPDKESECSTPAHSGIWSTTKNFYQ